MILSGFGHRLDELGGYNVDTLAKLTVFSIDALEKLGATKVISGMGLGWEQAIALAAIELELPFTAAILKGQQNIWPEKSQTLYRTILDQAATIKVFPTCGFTKLQFEERDEWIIDNSTGVLMLWNDAEPEPIAVVGMGEADKNITIFRHQQINNHRLRRTLEYAQATNRRIFQLWPFWKDFNTDVKYEVFRESMMGMSLE